MLILPHYQSVIALSTGLLLSGAVYAETQHHQYSAHQHGVVELNIAVDKQQLVFELLVPGSDAVGFEHAPSTAPEKQQLERALATLNQPELLFGINPAAQCEIQDVQVKANFDNEQEHAEPAHHEETAEHHEDEAEEHHEDEAEEHGELTAVYHYRCASIEKLQFVDNHWFKYFTNSQKIEVQVLRSGVQQAWSLNKEHTKILL